MIGNAAAEAHPIIGEGISMAMQSAWFLCERLIGRRACERVGRCAATRGRRLRQVSGGKRLRRACTWPLRLRTWP